MVLRGSPGTISSQPFRKLASFQKSVSKAFACSMLFLPIFREANTISGSAAAEPRSARPCAKSCFSFDDMTTHATRAYLQPLKILLSLLLGWTIPMCLEGLRACVDLIQHNCVGLLLRNKYLDLQGAGLGG